MNGRNGGRSAVAAHVRINLEMLNSPAFIALDWSARALFLDLRSRLRSGNNGDINAALSELVHRGWKSSTTLAKGLRQLEAVGLIRKTRKTIGVEHGSKLCNLYRFTDMEVFARPALGIEACRPSYEYRAFKSLTEARRAVAAAVPPQKKKGAADSAVARSRNCSVTPSSAADSAVTPLPTTADSAASKVVQIVRKANSHAGFAEA
nr:hypothetical protein [Variovorax boronicumulans]